MAKIHPDVASSLPHMMITPRIKNKQHQVPMIVDDEGFKSMVNEMTASQKAAALEAYRESLSSPEEHLPFGVEAVTYNDDEEHLDIDLEMDPSDFMEDGNLEITSDDEAEIAEYANEDIGENIGNASTQNAVETIGSGPEVYQEEQGLANEDVIIPMENVQDADDIAEMDDKSDSEERPGTAELVREIEDISNES